MGAWEGEKEVGNEEKLMEAAKEGKEEIESESSMRCPPDVLTLTCMYI